MKKSRRQKKLVQEFRKTGHVQKKTTETTIRSQKTEISDHTAALDPKVKLYSDGEILSWVCSLSEQQMINWKKFFLSQGFPINIYPEEAVRMFVASYFKSLNIVSIKHMSEEPQEVSNDS